MSKNASSGRMSLRSSNRYGLFIFVVIIVIAVGFLWITRERKQSNMSESKNNGTHYSFNYPSGFTPHVYGNPSNGVTYANDADKEGLVFTVENGTAKYNNSSNGVISRLAVPLFSSISGKITPINPEYSDYSNETVTKIKDLIIDGYHAVQFSDDYAATEQQPANFSNNYMIKINDSYFLIREGYTETKAELKASDAQFDQIVSTFRYQ